MEIEVAGEKLVLLGEKAVVWPVQRMLIVADTHVGKCAAFRASGIAVPETGSADLAGLTRLVREHGCQRLMILGDFFHSAEGRTESVHAALGDWRRLMPDLEISLILGNHDLAAGRPLVQWNFEVYPREHHLGPFVFRHAPGASAQGYVLSGHLHPSVRISTGRKSSLRAPCFCFGPDQAVLPAFGGLTGTHEINPGEGDRVYAVADGKVVEIPPQLFFR